MPHIIPTPPILEMARVYGRHQGAFFRPGVSFSKIPKSNRTRKAVAKSLTFCLQSRFIHEFFIRTEVTFIQEVSGVYSFSILKYRLTRNGFTDPKRFRGFRETGPWSRSPIMASSHCLTHIPTVKEKMADRKKI